MSVDRQIAFFVDTTKCINCKTCEVACHQFQDPSGSRRLRKVSSFEGGEFPGIYAYNISMSCNHCESPICVEHCPARAYTKRPGDGIVVHDPERCIGCRYCTWLCPYGAPEYDPEEGKVRKCNFCVDEVDSGHIPICVASCPMRAIEVGLLHDLISRPDATMWIRNVPSPSLTRPACRFKIRKEAIDDGA
jgi:anaerobic dimethyl sulfoxide reductase subunit B (iron-sulfur subunit)